MLSYYPHSNLCNTGAVNIPFFFLGAGAVRAPRLWRSLKRLFFFAGCCMAQGRSLSGRSPFCQRTQRIKSQCHFQNYHISWKQRQRKTNNQKKNTNLNAVSQRVEGGSDVKLANWLRREHACQPSEGEGTLFQGCGDTAQSCLNVKDWHEFATRRLSRFNLVKIGWHLILNL